MPEVIGDPEAIQNFANELREYCETTSDNLSRIRSRLLAMDDDRTWADDRYRRYVDLFEDLNGQLQRSMDNIRHEHLPHLYRVVERLQAVHEA
jgi:uncharacterized protein YukE